MEAVLYAPKEINYSKGWETAGKIEEENWNQIIEQDEKSKKAKTLIGRYIAEPFADGKAIYMIVSETKKKVKIQVCTGLGDDWVIPYWGPEATIDRSYAVKSIKGREALDRLFGRK